MFEGITERLLNLEPNGLDQLAMNIAESKKAYNYEKEREDPDFDTKCDEWREKDRR